MVSIAIGSFVQQGNQLGDCFCLSTKLFCFDKKCKLKKKFFIMTSRNPYDIHPGVVINRAKFDVCTCCSFGGVKAYEQTESRVIC